MVLNDLKEWNQPQIYSLQQCINSLNDITLNTEDLSLEPALHIEIHHISCLQLGPMFAFIWWCFNAQHDSTICLSCSQPKSIHTESKTASSKICMDYVKIEYQKLKISTNENNNLKN